MTGYPVLRSTSSRHRLSGPPETPATTGRARSRPQGPLRMDSSIIQPLRDHVIRPFLAKQSHQQVVHGEDLHRKWDVAAISQQRHLEEVPPASPGDMVDPFG